MYHFDFIHYKLSFCTIIILIAFSFASCTNRVTQNEGTEKKAPFSGEKGTLVLNNSGSNAYVVTEVNGEGIKTDLNENNVTITLTLGGRYTFENESGASNHPLDFINGNGDKLFGQSNSEGIYADNEKINIVREGDSITFTLTEMLGNDIVDYICSFHPTMKGEIAIGE